MRRCSAILLLFGATCCSSLAVTRRRALLQSGAAAANALPLLAHAAQKKYSARDAQDAIAAIRNARISLNDLDAPIAKGDFEGAAATLAASPIGDFERDATIIIQAPVLAAEDKKAIGTIRRYGVAADVIIMSGGLREALDNFDGRGAASYLRKTKGSLDEVLAIARDGGLR